MAGETQNSVWPLPKFYFSAQLGPNLTASFQEVTGIDTDAKPSAYRHDENPSFHPIKMPGLGKVGNVTLRKGIFANDATFRGWLDQIKLGTSARQTMVVKLLDEAGAPKMVWTLSNAWPTRVTGTDLQSEGNEVAVESVEIAYETLVVAAP